VYSVIEQADSLAANGRTTQAHAKYLEAQRDLTAFKQNNPTWNTQMVSYRMDYVADKIKATSGEAVSTAGDNNSMPKASSAAISPVKLLDAGSEPRKILRLHPVVGDKQSMTMNMQMSMAMSAAGNSMPAMNLPAMVMSMDSEVKDISPDGQISYAIMFSSADVVPDKDTPPATAAVMKTALAGLQGVSGTAKMSDRGVVKSIDLKVPPDAGAQLGQTIGQMKDSFSSSSSPLPEEAVGAGAKWEYHTRLKSQGMNMDQTMTMELVSIDGDTLNLRTTITQSAANQKIESPAMPGQKIDLTKLTGTGTGTTSLDLNHLMPQTASLDETTETAMSMNIGQKKQDMDMTMRMKIDIQTK
ncbi:MAG TPA: DUF6263 family protein, partial [Candidatus Sulfotelmatobacter sp.]|nr:DUF6263 family protein [Candidatus Sulfotelmatobacter sp.]